MILPSEKAEHERRENRHRALHLSLLRIGRGHADVANAEVHRERVDQNQKEIGQRQARGEDRRSEKLRSRNGRAGERASDPKPVLIGKLRLVIEHHIVDADDDRVLHEHRPTAGERIDALLLVKRHRFLLLFLLIVLIALLNAFEHRRNLLHLQERLELRRIERPEDQPDQRRQNDHAPAEISDRLVDRQDDPPDEANEGIEPRVASRKCTVTSIPGGARRVARRRARSRRRRGATDGSEQGERGQPATSHDPVLPDRRRGVVRAARVEAAGRRKQRGDQELVGADESQGGGSHAISLRGSEAEVTSARKSEKRASAATGRATTSSRIAARGASASRTIADKRRRSLLRTTAFPIDLLTVIPTRDDASPGGASLR